MISGGNSRVSLTYGQRRTIHLSYLKKQADAAKVWKAQAQEIRAGQKQSMLDILESRGYVGQIAGDRKQLSDLMIDKRVGAYVGIDPTAPSLHIGHLVPLMALFWMYIHGFHAVSLLGGATARVGDPTGRSTARAAQDSLTRKVNMAGMHVQLRRLWKKAEDHARFRYGYEWVWAWHRELCNNNAWLNKLPISELLRLLGRGLRMGPMLGRETFKDRMQSGVGMSFSEFMYPILQSWDWWYMYHTKNVQVQIGGSDQFGNIVAGMDAINYINKNHYDPDHRIIKDEQAYVYDRPMGFTTPLLTTSSGEKFGKSTGNAIWLEKEMTNSFDLYQFFLRTSDADVERYLKLFTFMPIPDIQTLIASHTLKPSDRLAQHRLAHEVLCLVHSEEDARSAAAQHASLFGRKPSASTTTNFESASPSKSFSPNPQLSTVPTNAPPDISSSLNRNAPITTAFNSPSLHITLPSSLVVSQPIARVLYAAGLVASRSEGHRLCAQEGAYVGNRPGKEQGQMRDHLEFTACKNWQPEDTNQFIIDGQALILRVGKWKIKIVKIVSDEEFEAKGLTCPGWKEEVSEEQTAREERAGDPPRGSKGGRSGNDSRQKRLDRAFGGFLERFAVAEDAGGALEDVKKAMGPNAGKREKEVVAHKHGIEV